MEVSIMDVLALGAESIIYRLEHWNQQFVLKCRRPKEYLHPDIDSVLRRTRTSRECKMLTTARILGVRTPAVYTIDLENCTLLMDFIDGLQFKQLVDDLNMRRLKALSKEFGRTIAKLHLGGVVHGDPTTSNILIDTNSDLWFVDFGLADMNATIEMKGVDLHLLHRALETTHWNREDTMLSAALEGYESVYGPEAEKVFQRMEEIRERGRYH
jgi:TP53 regulating kinase-like protein